MRPGLQWFTLAMAVTLAPASAHRAVPGTASIEGRVVDAATRLPVRGVMVRGTFARDATSDRSPIRAFLTGHDGRFVLRDLPAGAIDLTAAKTGYLARATRTITVAAGQPEVAGDLLLTREAIITGRVTDQSGDPMAAVKVFASRRDSGSSKNQFAVSNDEGYFSFGGLDAGAYVVGINESEQVGINRHGSVFFSGAAILADATLIEVAAGDERTGIHLMLDVKVPRLEPPLSPDADRSRESKVGGSVRNEAGYGLSRALVGLIQSEDIFGDGPTNIRTAITDQAGRFQFDGVPPGRWRIIASKVGYSERAGSGFPALVGTTVTLTGGQTLDVPLTLPRLTVISGTLIDQFGDPVAGVVTVGDRTARADSRGRFHIAAVGQAEHLLKVDLHPSTWTFQMSDESGQERSVAFLPVFYPGVASASLATPIASQPGRDLSGIDIVVRPTPVTTVDVTIDPAGLTIGRTRLELLPLDSALTDKPRAIVHSGTTRLTLDTLEAGRYLLIGAGEQVHVDGSVARTFWSSREVTIDGIMPISVTLPLEPGTRVSGRLIFEGTSPRPTHVETRLQPLPPITLSDGMIAKVTSTSGSLGFAVSDLLPGRYVVETGDRRRPPSGWILKAATAGGRDILDMPIDVGVAAELNDVVLTFTDHLTEIGGTVLTGSGRPVPDAVVVAFAADNRYWRTGSRRIRTAPTDLDGRYAMRALPPGEYRIAMTEGSDRNLLTALPKLLGRSIVVTLGEGEKKVQDLRVPAPPQPPLVPRVTGTPLR